MDVGNYLSSRYLSKEDLNGDAILTVRDVQPTTLDNNEEKLVLMFTQPCKPMLLNKTNLRSIAAFLGKETDDWKGQDVCVYVKPDVEFKGETVGGLRVRSPNWNTPEAGAPTMGGAQ